MTYATSPEVDEEPSAPNITPNMANRDLRAESCVFGALIPYATASTAFLVAKGEMMSFPPCSLVGQRRLKQWFMTLHVPSNHIA
jgi:hypothetical protein